MMSRERYPCILTNSRTHLRIHTELIRRFLLRKLALLAPVCAFLFFAQFASAQQVDVFLGGGTLLSSSNNNSNCISAATGLGCPPEKGGLYINLGCLLYTSLSGRSTEVDVGGCFVTWSSTRLRIISRSVFGIQRHRDLFSRSRPRSRCSVSI